MKLETLWKLLNFINSSDNSSRRFSDKNKTFLVGISVFRSAIMDRLYFRVPDDPGCVCMCIFECV